VWVGWTFLRLFGLRRAGGTVGQLEMKQGSRLYGFLSGSHLKAKRRMVRSLTIYLQLYVTFARTRKRENIYLEFGELLIFNQTRTTILSLTAEYIARKRLMLQRDATAT